MFHDPLFLYVELFAIPVAALAGIAAFKCFHVGPPRFKEPEHFVDHGGSAFVDSLRFDRSIEGNKIDDVSSEKLEGWRNRATGSIGELLTALIMVGRGWRQLPSQPDNGGIDGIFFRRLGDRSGGYKFCLVETKASTKGLTDALNNYDSNSNWLSDNQISRKLDELQGRSEGPYLAADVEAALRSALHRQPKYLAKRLFVHSYPDKATFIFALNAEGKRSDALEETIGDACYLSLLEALEIGISRLAKNVGVASRAIGVIDPRQVKMDSARKPQVHRRLGVRVEGDTKVRGDPFVLDYQI